MRREPAAVVSVRYYANRTPIRPRGAPPARNTDTANSLNQYSSRTVPGALDVVGLGSTAATATVNGGATYRRGEYFRAELAVTNASGPAAIPITALVGTGGTTNTASGFALSPPATQNLAYDPDGNLTNDLVWSYTWDAENRLLAVETLGTVPTAARARVAWDYDAAGRRVRQTVSTNWNGGTYSSVVSTLYLYDGWACVAELSNTGTLLRQYAWGLDLSGSPTAAGGVGGLLWMRPAGSHAHFAAFDGNGNVLGLVDGSNGTVSARYDYDPFGQTIRLTGTGAIAKDNPFRFSTKRADPTTGLVLYEYRAYSPSLGRWPNRDPIEEKGGMSLYVFVANSVHNLVELWGYIPIQVRADRIRNYLNNEDEDMAADEALLLYRNVAAGGERSAPFASEMMPPNFRAALGIHRIAIY